MIINLSEEDCIMRFTKEVLDYARSLSAKAYPGDAGGIHADCFWAAIMEFQRKHIPTLIVYE